jgi:hypothetical protein
MSQTSYETNFTPAIEGQFESAAGAPTNVRTYIASETIKFGRGVALDTGNQAKLPDTQATDVMLGITARSLESETSSYIDGDAMNVVVEGNVWCPVEVEVNVGDSVYARCTANGQLTELGKLRKDDDQGQATPTALQLANFKFLSHADAGDLALVGVIG